MSGLVQRSPRKVVLCSYSELNVEQICSVALWKLLPFSGPSLLNYNMSRTRGLPQPF
jgi:hypothetical protein